MEHPKFVLYDIQNPLLINTVIAVQVTFNNISTLPRYLEGAFCEKCVLLDGDELRLIVRGETVVVHPMEYILIDRNFNLLVMNERTFKLMYDSRGMKWKQFS